MFDIYNLKVLSQNIDPVIKNIHILIIEPYALYKNKITISFYFQITCIYSYSIEIL